MNTTQTSTVLSTSDRCPRSEKTPLSGSAGGGCFTIGQASSTPLGNTTKLLNPPTPPEPNTEAASDAKRVQKWVRQSAARNIVGGRLNACCRSVLSKSAGVDVWESKKKTFSYGGLIVCGSVWACPVCASKITEKRRQELTEALETTKSHGGAVVMLTLTVPHYGHHKIKNVVDGLSRAYVKFGNRKGFKRVSASIGLFGRIRALEVTYGRNGWHPHFHILLFLSSPLSARQIKLVELDLLKQWQSACVASGLPEPNKHGLSLDDGTNAAAYVSKWGLENEMTKGHLKTGKKKDHLSPFALLDLHIDRESAETPFQKDLAPLAGFLFHEYAKAFRGKHQLEWSRGLRDTLNFEPEKSDEELAVEHDQEALYFSKIPFEMWRLILKKKKRDQLPLIFAQGFDAFYHFCETLWKDQPVPGATTDGSKTEQSVEAFDFVRPYQLRTPQVLQLPDLIEVNPSPLHPEEELFYLPY